MRSLLYIIIVFVLSGCCYSSFHDKKLDMVQQLMHEDPQAALSALNDIDVSELSDSATIARWALLYSEAMVINRLSAPTDTIINIAIDYYSSRDMVDEYSKASKLKALILSMDNNDALATALYLQKEKEFMLYKERMLRERYMYICVIVLLVLTGVMIGMRQRIRLQAANNERLIAEASGLRCQIDESRADVGRLETKLHGLLEKRFALIDSLCQTYYESQGTKIEKKAIIDKVKSEIESIRSDSFADMECAVNDCRDNILVKVKDVYPDIKNEDYQLLVYLTGGLSSRSISLLLGESVEVVYKRKSRLKSRLVKLCASSDTDVMAIFGAK
ncbi:MAG: hypothetical protein K2M94_04985 [Paramuribaculum sp.]|nr:hypothetical protein [Paramuribaculum sp.]